MGLTQPTIVKEYKQVSSGPGGLLHTFEKNAHVLIQEPRKDSVTILGELKVEAELRQE